MKLLNLLLLSLVSLTTLCGRIPGLQPEVNSEATIAAAVAATLTAVPTNTPIPPTNTPVPTDTPPPPPTDTPTPTPAPTNTPEAISLSTPESSIIQTELESGEILYESPAEGFAMTLPSEWQVIDLDEKSLAEALGAVGEQNKALESLFTNEFFQSLIAAGIKFYAINTSQDSILNDIPATINVVKQELPIELTLDDYAALNIKQLEQFFDLTSEIQQEKVMLGNVEAVKVTYTTNLNNPLGQQAEMSNTQYLILNGSTAYVVTLSIPVSLAEQYQAGATKAVETFRLE